MSLEPRQSDSHAWPFNIWLLSPSRGPLMKKRKKDNEQYLCTMSQRIRQNKVNTESQWWVINVEYIHGRHYAASSYVNGVLFYNILKSISLFRCCVFKTLFKRYSSNTFSKMYAPPSMQQLDLSRIFQGVDRDNSGKYLAKMCCLNKYRSGSISVMELQQALSNGSFVPFNPETCRLMIGKYLIDFPIQLVSQECLTAMEMPLSTSTNLSLSGTMLKTGHVVLDPLTGIILATSTKESWYLPLLNLDIVYLITFITFSFKSLTEHILGGSCLTTLSRCVMNSFQ